MHLIAYRIYLALKKAKIITPASKLQATTATFAFPVMYININNAIIFRNIIVFRFIFCLSLELFFPWG